MESKWSLNGVGVWDGTLPIISQNPTLVWVSGNWHGERETRPLSIDATEDYRDYNPGLQLCFENKEYIHPYTDAYIQLE